MCDLLNDDNVFQLYSIGLSSEQFTCPLFLCLHSFHLDFISRLEIIWLIYCGCIYILLIQNASSSRKIYFCCLDSSYLGFAKLPSYQMTWERQGWGGSYSSRNLAIGKSIVRKLMWHLICLYFYSKKYSEKDR